MASDRRKTADPVPNADAIDTVRSLATVLDEHALTELIYDTPEVKITLRRGVAMAAPPVPMAMPMHAPGAPAPGPTSVTPMPVAEEKGHAVTSPFVGTFYRRPNPDAPAYVDINDRVEKGQVLCIVEAMKLMNEIEADVAGTVIGILAEDGAPVEYGQALFKIAPSRS